MKTEIKVTGMMCKGCTSRVEKKLTEMGCTEVVADFTKGNVVLELGNNTQEDVKAAIEKLGFGV